MKKSISILLLLVYLLSATQLSELLKVPLLIEHFLEHKQENKDLSVIGFLKIHYAQGSTKYADYDKDMKLPFKSISNSGYSSNSSITPSPAFKINRLVYFKGHKQQFLEYSFTYSSSILSSIWQPPKSC